MKNRIIVFVCAVAAWATWYWPSAQLRHAARDLFGRPQYAGPWATFEHVFLDSTLTALVCALVWLALTRAGLLPPMREMFRFPNPRRIVIWGIAGGLAALAPGLAMMAVADPKSLGYVPPSGWMILGNVFSNFYEEFIHRGFLLTALSAATGNFWIAALLSSAAFGFEHAQYPLPLRILIAGSGVLWCWLRKRSGTLFTPYISHEVLDLIGDMLVK